MILFVLCFNPILCYLDERLQGLRAHRTQRKTTVIAYADDVSILMTSQEDVRTVRDAIACYEKATGATLNIEKSSALEGTWDTACEIMGIQSALASWTRLLSLVRTQARRAYSRDLNVHNVLHMYRFICSPNYGILRKCYSPPVSASGKLYRPLCCIYDRAPFFECHYQHCRGVKRTAFGV